jgi:hypothetical protein
MAQVPTIKPSQGRPSLTPPAAPKKRGKTAEQYEAELALYRLAMRRHFAAIAAFSFESGVGAAIRRSGNPASGKVGDAKLIRKFGDVPDDLSAFVKPD